MVNSQSVAFHSPFTIDHSPFSTPSVHVHAHLGHKKPYKALVLTGLENYTKGYIVINFPIFVNGKKVIGCNTVGFCSSGYTRKNDHPDE